MSEPGSRRTWPRCGCCATSSGRTARRRVEEQRTLAAWSGWGAVPGVFDEDRDEWAQARAELLELVGEDGYAAARRTTINAHYTDPAIVAAIWQLVQELGFDGGRVLEPGCGIGTFLGLAPAGR